MTREIAEIQEETLTTLKEIRDIFLPVYESENIELDAIGSDQNFDLDFGFVKYQEVEIQINWKDFDVGDGVYKFQENISGENRYVDISGVTGTLTVGTDQFDKHTLTALNTNVIRLVYTAGTDTTGDIESVDIIARPKLIS